MTQEQKHLLLVDLCARLPYGVKVDLFGQSKELIGVLNDIISVGYDINDYEDAPIEDIKPYLRPISSMTEEESKEFALLQTDFYVDGFLYPIAAINMVNWLNEHHFDYCGLIEKGLALEAPEDMYQVN